MLGAEVRYWLERQGKMCPFPTTSNDKSKALFKDIFDSLDCDGSGRLDVGELQLALRVLGKNVTKKMVQEMISEVRARARTRRSARIAYSARIHAQVDTSGEGELDFNEFVWIMKNPPKTVGAVPLDLSVPLPFIAVP